MPITFSPITLFQYDPTICKLRFPKQDEPRVLGMAWYDDVPSSSYDGARERLSKRHSMGAGGPKRDACSCASDEPPARHASAGHLFEEDTSSRAERASGSGFPNLESSSGGSSKTSANPEPPEETLTVGNLRPPSTCVEPDHRELIRSVSVVLHRRIRDNEDAESKLLLPLFCEDTHTEAPPEPEYEVSMPTLPVQALGFVSLYALTELLPPPVIPRVYEVPTVATVCDFIENIWHRARLTPQSVVICLIYVDRLEARPAWLGVWSAWPYPYP